MHVAVLAALAVLVVGLYLISIPYSGPRNIKVRRDDVGLDLGIGQGTSVDLMPGHYEVCIEDKDPGIQDYGSFVFEIESLDATVPVERSDGSVVRELDGVPYEVVCGSTITRGDLYFYDISIDGPELNGTWVVMVIAREATRLDQPAFLAGVGLVFTALVVIPIAIMLLRQPARPPDMRRTGEGPPAGPAPVDTEAKP